ncbi:hypothetical protein FB45DRAFT_1020027 [Roridomyces roridus]|uniref:Homeobox domain-containing protein n=1 Tax=Roridomyces roridus TaxID=1738132 RepID=A0AAD7CG69_9AGAR|nr:hypothetical protein FB45DRAFT_1020027 [Roridomyces roridus]
MEVPPAVPAAAPAPSRQAKKRMSPNAIAILKGFAETSLRPTSEQGKALVAEIQAKCPAPSDQQTTVKHVEAWFKRERERRNPTSQSSKPAASKSTASKTKTKSPPNPNPAYPSLTAHALVMLESTWAVCSTAALSQRLDMYETWKSSPLWGPGATEADVVKWVEDHDPEYKAHNTTARATAPPLRVNTSTAAPSAAKFKFGIPTPTMSETASTSPEPVTSASTSPTTSTTALPASEYRTLTLSLPHRYPTPADSRASASMSPTTSTVQLPSRHHGAAPRFHPYRDYRPPTPSSRAASLVLKSEPAGSLLLPAIATLETELEVPLTPVLDDGDEDETMLDSPQDEFNDPPPEPERTSPAPAPPPLSAEFGKNYLLHVKQRIEDGTLDKPVDNEKYGKYGPVPTTRAEFDARFSSLNLDKTLDDLLQLLNRGMVSNFPSGS